MAHQRVMQNAPASISATFPDQFGEPRAPQGAVSALVETLTGVTLQTLTAEVDPETKECKVVLPTLLTASLTRFRIIWTDELGKGRTTVEVVGGYYFSLYELRAAEQSLRETVKYPDDDILFRVRQEVEEECERICNRAFVPRAGRITLDGSGRNRLALNVPDLRRVVGVSVGGVPASLASLKSVVVDGSSIVWGPLPDVWTFGTTDSDVGFPYGRGNITIDFEWGWDSPPADLKRGTIKRLRQRLNADKSTVMDRATTVSNETGSYVLFTPGVRGAHLADPELNDLYASYAWNAAPTSAALR